MKKKFYVYLAIFLLNVLNNNLFSQKFESINSLNWAEVYSDQFAPQITFDFSNPIYFEKNVDKDNYTLELAFPGMSIKDFKKSDISSKIKKINNIVKEVKILNKELPCPRVVLSIKFATSDVIVKWSKMEDPNRLILNMFLKSKLDNIDKNDSVVLYASNNIGINDDSLKVYKTPPRIVLDPGHGGSDTGAKGFYSLVEKNLTLDIAYRVKKLLKKAGFKVAMTRTNDTDISLQDRSELAMQLKANLMVSIHGNAAYSKNATGIESFYLNSSAIVKENSGFLFTETEKDLQYESNADKFLAKLSYKSKQLANSVHNGVLDFLQRNKQNILDRNIKPAAYRILLNSQMPVTLIEVGFLTNEQDAKRLKDSSYREILAEGICNGIKSYLFVNG